MRVRRMLAILMFPMAMLAGDLNGIWTGFQEGRGGQQEDVAFRLQSDGRSVSGKLFGDEFDLPLSEGTITGDQIRFAVITTNYYSGVKVKFVYTGTLRGDEMELVRERILTDEDKASKQKPTTQKITLKRLQ